jgi:hypothetical protein
MRRKDKHKERADAKPMDADKLRKEVGVFSDFVDRLFAQLNEQRAAMTQLFQDKMISDKDLKQFNTYLDGGMLKIKQGLDDLRKTGVTKGQFNSIIEEMNKSIKIFNEGSPKAIAFIQSKNPDFHKENIEAPKKKS